MLKHFLELVPAATKLPKPLRPRPDTVTLSFYKNNLEPFEQPVTRLEDDKKFAHALRRVFLGTLSFYDH